MIILNALMDLCPGSHCQKCRAALKGLQEPLTCNQIACCNRCDAAGNVYANNMHHQGTVVCYNVYELRLSPVSSAAWKDLEGEGAVLPYTAVCR